MVADDSLICGDRLVCERMMKKNEMPEGKMKEYKLLGADGEGRGRDGGAEGPGPDEVGGPDE